MLELSYQSLKNYGRCECNWDIVTFHLNFHEVLDHQHTLKVSASRNQPPASSTLASLLEIEGFQVESFSSWKGCKNACDLLDKGKKRKILSHDIEKEIDKQVVLILILNGFRL